MENSLSECKPASIISTYAADLQLALSDEHKIPPVFLVCPTSLKMTTEEDKATFLNALSTPSHNVDEIIDTDIQVTGYILTAGESDEEDEEGRKNYPRMILFMPNGATVAITSETVIRRMATLLIIYGPAPWTPPLRLIIRSVKAKKSGRTYHDITILPRLEE